MSEWWTYTLADIKSFTLATYYRLFELHNRAIWPAQVVALLAGLWILAVGSGLHLPHWGSGLHLPHRGPGRHIRGGRVIAAILAACWLFVAVVFHAHRYATLTWSARYYTWAFGLEAVLLLWSGVIRGRLSFERYVAGLAIFLFALVVHPLIEPLIGRRWPQVEVFGVAPDPTAIATLGLLLLAAGRVRWELAAIPLLWCAVSGATLLSMNAPDAGIPLAAVAIVLVLSTSRTLGRRRNVEVSPVKT